jgi:hypothetical protein
MNIKAAFTALHQDLTNHSAIQVISNKNSFASINQDKYIQRIEMKLGAKLPEDWKDYLMMTYSNSMNYHYHINDIPTGQGNWNFLDVFDYIKTKPKAAHLIGEEDKLLVIVDHPASEDDVYAAYEWGTGEGYLPGTICFYKNGKMAKTSMDFKAYLENTVHCMGAMHWPLLFTDLDPDHHSFEFEFMKLNQNFGDLKSLFPHRNWEVFEGALKKKGLR